MTATERKSNLKLSRDTPYLALTGELWGVCSEHFKENSLRYNGTALYRVFYGKQVRSHHSHLRIGRKMLYNGIIFGKLYYILHVNSKKKPLKARITGSLERNSQVIYEEYNITE